MTMLSIMTDVLDDPRIKGLSDSDFRTYITALAAEAACGRERFNTCALCFALGVTTFELWGILKRLQTAGLCSVESGEGLRHPQPLTYTPLNDALKARTWPSSFTPIVPDKHAHRVGSSSTNTIA